MTRNIIKFPNRKGANLDKEFESLIDDMGGWLWSIKSATHKSWEELSGLTGLSIGTLLKVADREYVSGPTARTFYKIIRALDDRAMIKHSMFERYGSFGRKEAKRLDRELKKA